MTRTARVTILLMLVSSGSLWSGQAKPGEDLLAIQEAGIRLVLQGMLATVRARVGIPDPKVVFIGVESGQDPSAGLVKRLSDTKYVLRPFSQCTEGRSAETPYCDPGRGNLLVWLGKAQWISSDVVHLEIEEVRRSTSVRGCTWAFRRRQSTWAVDPERGMLNCGVS
jgi:hypothetical protein